MAVRGVKVYLIDLPDSLSENIIYIFIKDKTLYRFGGRRSIKWKRKK